MRFVLIAMLIVGLTIVFSIFPEGLYLKSTKEGSTLICTAYNELAQKGFRVNAPLSCQNN